MKTKRDFQRRSTKSLVLIIKIKYTPGISSYRTDGAYALHRAMNYSLFGTIIVAYFSGAVKGVATDLYTCTNWNFKIVQYIQFSSI